MAQEAFGDLPKRTKIEDMSRTELTRRYLVIEDELKRLAKENYELRGHKINHHQLSFILEEQISELKEKMFGASSERYKKPENINPKKDPKPRVKKPSERYPNVPVREVVLHMDRPQCGNCGSLMTDSGLREESEQLTVIPKKYEITCFKRVIYRCSCQNCLLTTPAPKRIIEGSSYSDEMIIDVALSKYLDLIPMQRYVAMAARGGVFDIPPHSLIELTHGMADFLSPLYAQIKEGILRSRVLHADETPHKMLEGAGEKSWYLWGFSNPTLCFLDCRNTRSGDVASELLIKSQCEVLISDVFSGYSKAIKETNKQRELKIKNAYCNSHARRYFYKPRITYKEAEFYLDAYHEIYKLNTLSKEKSPPEVLQIREQMLPYFEKMRIQAEREIQNYPEGTKYYKALNYFLENYEELTLFLKDPEVSIDNNAQERLLRSHVVGRKTWYGTHSLRGAQTAAILFSIIETCKLNNVNPREYLPKLVTDMFSGQAPYLPTKKGNSEINR
jgi:transposase